MEGSSMEQSFISLRKYFVSANRQMNTANPAQLVIFAENAFKGGYSSLASECLETYFSLDPPTNQFLIRAHLCRALAVARANDTKPEESLQKAVECIVTAVDIAKKSECYHFLVHNASVLLWQICRPHCKPGWMGMCVCGWQSVAQAQELCKEGDYAWRLCVLQSLIQSQVDAGLTEEAVKTSHSAIQLARKKVPAKLPDILKLHMFHGLGEGKTVDKEMKPLPEIAIFAKLYKLRHESSMRHSELESQLRKLLEATLAMKPTGSRKTPGPGKQQPPTQPLSPETKATLLLEIAQVCVDEGLVGLCSECVEALPGEVEEPRLDLLRHTVTSQLSLLSNAHTSPLSRGAVEVREQTIAQLENCVIAAQRLGDHELVQHVGVVLWGVCLPLLQPSLRNRLSHTLSTLASALEQVDSLLHSLRSAVHMELAKVCADQDHLQTALEHVIKARELDSECEWSEQLRWLGERLKLRSELYLTPSSSLQQATQLLEQVSSSSDCGRKDEMRAVLVKIGALLAPNFRVAIGDRKAEPPAHTQEEQDPGEGQDTAVEGGQEGEGERREENGDGKETSSPSVTSVVSDDSEYPGVPRPEEGERREGEWGKEGEKRAEKLYEILKEEVKTHKDDIGTDDEIDRGRLWATLAKVSRKHEVWDVAFVASKFCLTYDDKRWTVELVKTAVQPSKTGSKNKLQKTSSMSVNRSRSDASNRTLSSTAMITPTAGPAVAREEGEKRGRERLCRELIRTLAETHCIHAECAVYQLKECGRELGHGFSLPPRDQQQSEPTGTNDMLIVWPGQFSSDAYSSFLRAAELGCSLHEAWLVANAATYLCNYSHHLLQADLLSSLVPVFRPLLASVVAVREHATNTHTIDGDVVCRLSTILAGGLVQTWMPSPPDPNTPDPSLKTGGRKSGRGTATGKKKGGGGGGVGETQLQVSEDARPSLQEALEVCERGLEGASELTLAVRAALLAVWVQCKQLLQQPISSKTLGVNKEDGDSGVSHCRAVVAVEMLSLMGNRIWNFPDCPSLNDAFELVTVCQWSDVLLELELLTRIARLALLQASYSLVSSCSKRALQSVEKLAEGRGGEGRKMQRDVSAVQREKQLLSSISSLHGQSLVAGGGGRVVATRAAMNTFLQSAKYGRDAGSYQCVVEACQHYWNTCRELTASPLDREAVKQPLTELLAIFTSFLPKRTTRHSVEQVKVKAEDLQLYVAMYNIIFQVYIDKGEWEEGLKAVEEAMWVTPRTIHRDLAQHKLVFKSKMGKSVEGDMIRFQDDSEEERARLWYSAACNSTSFQQQLTAFKNAINTLTSSGHIWQKMEYIQAFSEWLYAHQYPLEDVLSHFKWALSLLLQTREEGEGEQGEREEEPTSSVRVLEEAVQVHVKMAQLQGRGSHGHRESCLAALAYCQLIWKATVEAYSQSVSGKCDVQLPTSAQEWTNFTFFDGLRDYVKSSDNEQSMNAQSIKTPTLMCHYLAVLSDELCVCGLHALALPVETLRLLAAECLVQSVSASQLAHLRLVSLCTALGAQGASKEHWKQAGQVYLNAEELARSHADMCQYQLKLNSVEEKCSKLKDRQSNTLSALSPQPPAVCGTTVLHEVWVEEAAILIKQGQFQVARELLQQVNLAAQVFGDGQTMGRMLMTQASLAAAEKRVNESIHCLCEAQSYPMSLDQWEDGMLLLLTVALQSPSYLEPCVAAVSDAVSSLNSTLLFENCNERRRVECTQTTLRARLAAVRAEILLDRPEKNMGELERLCEEMCVHTDSLLQMGRCEAAARAMLDNGRVLLRCATCPARGTSHRAFLLKAVESLERAVSTIQSVLEDALSLCPLSDGLHLPGECVLVEAQLEMANGLLQIAHEHVLEKRQKRQQEQQKSCIEKMIDNYVRESPEQNAAEEHWNSVASIAADRALAGLTSISTHPVVQSQTKLRAKCVYGIGRALLLVSEHCSPDPPCTWREGHITEETSQTASPEESGRDAGQLKQHSTLSLVMRKEDAANAEVAESESIRHLAMASQSLGQALDLALKCGEKEIVEMAALKILNSCGRCDPQSTALHLALYQSCVTSRRMLHFLHHTQSDLSDSKLAALLHQHTELSRTHLSSSSILLGAVTAELDTYTCWQRLQVNADHLDLLRYFPPHFRFLVLQHSEDKSQLYAAYIIPPQPPSPAPKKGQPSSVTVSEVAVVSQVSVLAGDRERLLQLVDMCKRLQAQQLLKSLSATTPPEYEMSVQFNKISDSMNSYLSSALEPITRAIQKEKSENGLTFVILADFDLLKLPLEALNVLQLDCIKAVARDFSLQMLYNRIKKFLVEDEDAGAKKKDKFTLQPSVLQANTSNFRYVFDPRCELSSSGEEEQPSVKIVSQINTFPKITSKWAGHCGGRIEDAMSSNQWYPILKQCSGLLFFGSERLLAHFPPRHLVGLSMQDCSVAVVMDHMKSLKSSLTQSKLDIQKSTEELQTEQSLQSAVLLSLAGVDSLISRQWHSPVSTCADTMCSFIKQLLSDGVSIADMKWREVREVLQCQTQQREGENSSGTTLEEPSTVQSTQHKDLASVYNSIVYGLPHVVLNLPA